VPKRAADSVQSIRIELQETERAALEASLTAGGISNLLHGVGAVLLPFQGAITALAAAWVAGEIADEVKEQLDKVVKGFRGDIQEPIANHYQAITAFLYPIPLRRFNAFILQSKQPMFMAEMEKQNLRLSEAWAIFYPWEEMLNDAIYDANQRVSRISWFFDLITPNPK
jgi:hypothetical protein